ncbi:hypothetical protein [Paeniglutamicibacter sp. Y32M11]|uniref:hypothetical protein n=1 Tax=Paeniglutamicibacter sp. Y32M11 TaxID=2853258 RepID=UPI001C532C67|nr:hypothetical protein [Paeniglutamicibacter sp. Y32M11]QXQ11480.1 hypothetical protein KUF55_06235 [Paeniglutamicibacter sp. Y32M11]
MIEYELPNANWANVDLVGEYYRQSTIIRMIGGRPKAGDSKQVDVRVHLVPEPDNPYSPNGDAISARIDGDVVGYLSSDDAQKWHKEIHRIAMSGAVAVTNGNVLAYNRTKWDKNGRTRLELEVNIRVALPDPGFLVPLNAQTLDGIAILPWGNALQVTGEDKHLQHLFEYVPPGGQCLVVLSLHSLVNTLKNGTIKELVEVRLDGERVGQLTPASSLHFLPTIAHSQDMGKTLGVWSKLKGSGLAVELTVQGARATDLQDAWLRMMPTLPGLVPEASSYDVPNAYIPESNNLSRGTKSQKQASVSAASSPRPMPKKPRQPASADLLAGSQTTSRLEYKGDRENTTTYRSGKRNITFADKQRRHSPGVWSAAAWTVLITCCLIGLICTAGAPVGLVFTGLFVALGIYVFRGQRLIAEALRFEHAQNEQDSVDGLD